VESGVPGDPTQRDRVVKDQVGEEAPVLVRSGGIVREEEAVALQVFPKQLGSQRVILGPVLGATVRAFEGPSDGIVRIGMLDLHALPNLSWV
jgi:hypothetical protein